MKHRLLIRQIYLFLRLYVVDTILHYSLCLLTSLLWHHGASVFTSYFPVNVFVTDKTPPLLAVNWSIRVTAIIVGVESLSWDMGHSK